MAITENRLKQVIVTIAIFGVLAVTVLVICMEDPAKPVRENYQSGLHTSVPPSPPTSEDGIVQPGPIYPDGEKAALPEISTIPNRPGAMADPLPTPRSLNTETEDIPPPPPVPDILLTPRFPVKEPSIVPPEIRIAPQRYLFNNLSTEAVQGQPLHLTKSDKGTPIKGRFAPQGEFVQLALLDSVISNRREIDVVAGVWDPLYFGGNKLLETGDKLLGRAAPGKFRGRLEITFHKVVLKDGRSFPIQAVGQDLDGSIGIPGRQVGSSLLHSITPILLDMASSFSNSFKNRVLVGGGISGNGYTTAPGGLQDVPDLRNASITGAQGGISKVQSILAEEIEENRPYLIVPAGTRCRAMLTQFLDVSLAAYGK